MACMALNYSLLSGPPFPRGSEQLDEMISEILPTLPKVVFVHGTPATGKENAFSASPGDSQPCIRSLLRRLVRTRLPQVYLPGSRASEVSPASSPGLTGLVSHTSRLPGGESKAIHSS